MMQMNFHRKLPIPQEVKKEFPLTEHMMQIKEKRDESIRAVFNGSSDKFILIIGPCSADHREPVLEYISRLRRMQEQVADKIIIVPRIYTNKPRTTGDGYKGLLHQPKPDGKLAQLNYTMLGCSTRYTLVEVELLTGRHHQIRAQLSKIGCPIKGDLKYGAKRSNPDGGISLHSRSIEFIHPVRKEPLKVVAPTPAADNLWQYFETM